MSYSGYIFIIDEPERASIISEIIEDGGIYSDTFSVPDWKPKDVEWCFLSLDTESINYAALVMRGRRAATLKYSVHFSRFVRFDPPISFSSIEQHLSHRVNRYFSRSTTGIGNRLPEGTWSDLIRVVKEFYPETASQLDELENLRRNASFPISGRGYETLAEEKDSFNLAMRLAGFEQKGTAVISSWQAPENSDEPIPFVQGIVQGIARPTTLYEDRVIETDAEIFGDWQSINRYTRGERVFRQGNSVLSIANVNRTSVEKSLGVDLLYYQHEFKSFVLVQYKRMELEGITLRYRPDDRYESEIQRMREFRKENANEEALLSDVLDFRLSSDAFYFKLHDGVIFNPLETGLSRGMYIPLGYWDQFIDSPQAKGKRGGISVSYDNIGRYLPNTDFITLVQNGWIGSKGSASSKLEKMVSHLIAGGHSVTVAIKSKAAA